MKVEYYRSKKNGQWYWRLRSRNGRKITTGGEGFKRKSGCLRSIDAVRKAFAFAKYVIVETKG